MQNRNLKKELEASIDIIESRKKGEDYYNRTDYDFYTLIYNNMTINHRNLYDKMGNQWTNYLGVIGSVHPSLNALCKGSKNLTLFDINALNIHYDYLVFAAVLTLTFEEFQQFLYQPRTYLNPFFFHKIQSELPEDTLKYWKRLYEYPMDDFKKLFYVDDLAPEISVFSQKLAKQGNLYWSEASFNQLKERLRTANIKMLNADFGELPQLLKPETYHVIYLSCMQNLIYDNIHGYNYIEKLEEYERLLTNQGVIQGAYFYQERIEQSPISFDLWIEDFVRNGYQKNIVSLRSDFNPQNIALIKKRHLSK